MNLGGGTRRPCSYAAMVDTEYPVSEPNSGRSIPARTRNRFNCRPKTRRDTGPGLRFGLPLAVSVAAARGRLVHQSRRFTHPVPPPTANAAPRRP
ncbi:hypothetical protein GCM10023238_11510 [Streptomyces heliomycini]